jgi:hypothetical protein
LIFHISVALMSACRTHFVVADAAWVCEVHDASQLALSLQQYLQKWQQHSQNQPNRPM